MKLTDEVILEVIRESSRQPGRRPNGTLVRRELERRYGARAGTNRVYRLIEAAAASEPKELARLQADLASVREDLRQALERAALAEHREQAHLQRWSTELHALREKVAFYESQSGHRAHAQLQSERLDLLKKVTVLQMTNSQLSEAMRSHGIPTPDSAV